MKYAWEEKDIAQGVTAIPQNSDTVVMVVGVGVESSGGYALVAPTNGIGWGRIGWGQHGGRQVIADILTEHNARPVKAIISVEVVG